MQAITYRCPTTRRDMIHRLDEMDLLGDNQRYLAVLCRDCFRLHFVHRTTGRILGQDDESRAPGE